MKWIGAGNRERWYEKGFIHPPRKCKLCEERFVQGVGARYCDPCWELDLRVRMNPSVARKILAQLEG